MMQLLGHHEIPSIEVILFTPALPVENGGRACSDKSQTKPVCFLTQGARTSKFGRDNGYGHYDASKGIPTSWDLEAHREAPSIGAWTR